MSTKPAAEMPHPAKPGNLRERILTRLLFNHALHNYKRFWLIFFSFREISHFSKTGGRKGRESDNIMLKIGMLF